MIAVQLSRSHLIIPLLAILCTLCSLDPHLARAQDRAMECRGINMLDELKTANPTEFRRVEAEAKATENGNAIFWKIEKDGRPPSHIFGTIHLTDPRVTTLPAAVEAALSKSSGVLLEIADLSPETSADGLSKAMGLALYTSGESLEAKLTPGEFEKVRQTLTRSGIPPEAAKVFRPWIVSMLLASTECERKKSSQGIPVLDMKIAAVAKERNIPVAGLETIESQLAALASVPADQQLLMLKSALVYADRSNDLVETTLQLYVTRNVGAVWPFQLALARKSGFEEKSFSGARQVLIYDRNIKMRDGALPYLEKGAAFIAVGALHLAGKMGLVELLREEGYTLTPVE